MQNPAAAASDQAMAAQVQAALAKQLSQTLGNSADAGSAEAPAVYELFVSPSDPSKVAELSKVSSTAKVQC